MKRNGIALLALVVVTSIVLDQLIKLWVEASMPLHSSIEILPFLALLHAQNTGIAFSFLSGMDGMWLGVIAIFIVIFISALAVRTDPAQIFARVGFALIVGGAVGNLIDRFARGYVVDYVYFHTPVWSFAIFNLADAFITIGAGLVVLEEFLSWRKSRKAGQISE